MIKKIVLVLIITLACMYNAYCSESLDLAYVWPNPCNKYDGQDHVTFSKIMPVEAEIKIYTLSGELVKVLKKSSTLSSTPWYLDNENGDIVMSGIYIYIIKADNMSKSGKVIIIS